MGISWLIFMGSLFTTITYWTFGFKYVKNKMEDKKDDN
jgi:hypothetical protein